MHKRPKFALLSILWACIAITVHANDNLSDFSNDLATDLGPLLVFGGSMTKQYLSESSSFLDYFIFAMAPIGLLTTIVSTIRLCGPMWLRAFIDRAQEGDSVMGPELCTSTNRDVCEPFNKGGITRVLGKPTILELVYTAQSQEGKSAAKADTANLFLFRDYLGKYNEDEGGRKEWDLVQGSLESDEGDPFAPNPSFSLNVGTIKPPTYS